MTNSTDNLGGTPAPASAGSSANGQRGRCPSRRQPVHLPNVERHNQPVIIFLTVCTANRRTVLTTDDVHRALIAAWQETKQWQVGRYIIMPDHIHLFCSPAVMDAEDVANWTAYWTRLVSRRLPHLQPLWQRDCWDTQLRDLRHYDEKWQYVLLNPVRKKLVTAPVAWPYQGELHELRW
jgi:putative transposase